MERAKKRTDAMDGELSEGTARLETLGPQPIVRKLVVIRCRANRRVAAAPVFDRDELRRTGTDLEMYEVATASEAQHAFARLRDGDILVLNAHANQDLFVYRDAPRSEVRVRWSSLWKHFAIVPPPRLAATILAGCTVPKKTLTRSTLRGIRTVLNSSMFVAPFATAKYAVAPFGADDHIVAKKMGMAIAKFTAGQLSMADVTEDLFVNQTRFGVVYGCNGYNHPLGCGCGFGTPHLTRRRR